MSAWTDHVSKWKDCTACLLSKQRGHICLARGQLPSDVVFVGEAPGASEDATGLVFWGPAGTLLDNPTCKPGPGIVQAALAGRMVDGRWQTDLSVAYTNLVACYPREAKERGDNEPEDSEIKACRPRLIEFIQLAHPRLVVCVGSLAEKYVPPMTLPYIHIVHPAAILRMPIAQRLMAIQKSIVVIRNAVEEMV